MSKRPEPAPEMKARDVKTNNYFELLLLDKKGDPWRGVEPRMAVITAKAPPLFVLQASWRLDGSSSVQPKYLAIMLAGTAISVRRIRFDAEDEAYDDVTITVRQEIRFTITD